MADAPAPAAPKVSKPKAPKKPAAHPPTSEMVMKALVTLKERKGSSLPAIKKYIAANYKVRASWGCCRGCLGFWKGLQHISGLCQTCLPPWVSSCCRC